MQLTLIAHSNTYTVIHFYFGADSILVISVQAFFTEIKALPKF